MEDINQTLAKLTNESLAKHGAHIHGFSAGAPAMAKWLEVPGSSKVIGSWTNFNDRELLDGVLGGLPVKYVNEEVAVAYANSCMDALTSYPYGINPSSAVFVGVTASLTSDYDKRSNDEAYIALKRGGYDGLGIHAKFFKGQAGDMAHRTSENSFLTHLILWGVGQFDMWGDVKGMGINELEGFEELYTWTF